MGLPLRHVLQVDGRDLAPEVVRKVEPYDVELEGPPEVRWGLDVHEADPQLLQRARGGDEARVDDVFPFSERAKYNAVPFGRSSAMGGLLTRSGRTGQRPVGFHGLAGGDLARLGLDTHGHGAENEHGSCQQEWSRRCHPGVTSSRASTRRQAVGPTPTGPLCASPPRRPATHRSPLPSTYSWHTWYNLEQVRRCVPGTRCCCPHGTVMFSEGLAGPSRTLPRLSRKLGLQKRQSCPCTTWRTLLRSAP